MLVVKIESLVDTKQSGEVQKTTVCGRKVRR
jgi:hypothetical protein